MNVLASVVVTTYNGEKYILEQLQSILEQSYSDIEVYILDDKSTDHTPDLVQNFIIKNKLIDSWHLIINEKNKGWRKNFVDGMKLCKGDYIFPCDQDDIWLNNKIELMITMMESNKEINLLASNVMEFSDNNDLTSILSINDSVYRKKISKNFLDVELPGCSYCVRKTFFKNIMSCWWEKEAHDAFLWRYSLFTHSLYITHEILMKQRIHNDSTYKVESFRKWKYEDRTNEINYLIQEIKNIIEYCNNNVTLSKKEKDILNGSNEWILSRNRLYKHFNIKDMVKLAFHSGYYNKYMTYCLDVYLSLMHLMKKGDQL